MAGDLKRLGERITELRGQTPAAVIARRAGCSAAYLHQIEKAKPDPKSKRPIRPTIVMLRSIAWALPGAVTSELLELAGYEEDIIAYDRMREQRAARASTPVDPGALTSSALVAEIRSLMALYEENLAQSEGEGGPEAPPFQVVARSSLHTGTRGTSPG